MPYTTAAKVKLLAGIASADTDWDTDITNTLVPMAEREVDLHLKAAGETVPLTGTIPSEIDDVTALFAAVYWWENRATVLGPAAAEATSEKISRSFLRKRAMEILKLYIKTKYSFARPAIVLHPTDDFYNIYPIDTTRTKP